MSKYRRNRKRKRIDELPAQFIKKRPPAASSLFTMDKRGKLSLLADIKKEKEVVPIIETIKNHDISNAKAYLKSVHPRLAYYLCWRYHYTLARLGEAFGDTIDSVYFWYRNYPEFKEAVDTGRQAYRINHLEDALMKKATGYEYDQVKVTEVEVPVHLPTGGVVEVPGAKKEVTRKAVPPSIAALTFALTNFDDKKWRSPQQNVKVDSTTKSQSQSIDWNKALDKIGVEGVKQLVGTLKQISATPVPPD